MRVLEKTGAPADTAAMRPGSFVALVALSGVFTWITQPDVMARLSGMESRRDAAGDTGDDLHPRAGAIDPTPYRDGISAIEQVLYRDTPLAPSDPETVSRLAMQLGDRLYADLGPLRGRRALVDLVGFASSLDAQSEIGFAAPTLDGPRADWETLRTTWFDRAPWFRQTTARLVAAQRPPTPAASLDDIQGLREWALGIAALIEGGRTEMQRHGEVMVDAAEGSQAERVLVGRWRTFARDWDERVRALDARAPRDLGLDGEPHLVLARQELEQAVRQLALATTSEGDYAVPMKWWRAQCLDNAATRVESARAELKQIRIRVHAKTAAVPAARRAP